MERQKPASYVLPASLVNGVLVSVCGACIAVGGYMVRWNRDDLADKQTTSLRLSQIESAVSNGVLPRADERIRNLEIHHNELVRETRAEHDKLERLIDELQRSMAEHERREWQSGK